VSDYHVHLHEHGPYSGVGPAPGEYPPGHIKAYVDAAAARGVFEIGFTEHLYRCVESEEVLGHFWQGAGDSWLAGQTESFVTEDRTLSLTRYIDAVLEAKHRGLPVLLGLEVDFFPDTIDRVMALLDPYPWDFLIGSVHWVGPWSIDHGDAAAEFDFRGVERSWVDYFELEIALAESGAVDVLAHADVVKKFGYRLHAEPLELYRQTAEAAAFNGMAVELNSNGLNTPAAEIYPSAAFLAEFRAAGVPITFGSDAHRPEDAGRGRIESEALARSVGYETRARYEQRRRTTVDI